MDLSARKRLDELRSLFIVTEVNGTAPPHDLVAETMAMYLNKKYGRQVVVLRDRKGASRSGVAPLSKLTGEVDATDGSPAT